MASSTYKSTFRIGPKSKLKLLGTTNVNSFECQCQENFPSYSVHLKKEESSESIFYFENTSLAIPIASLNCGNPLMNRDLQKTLNAKKYPTINIEILKATNKKHHKLNTIGEWIMVNAMTRISINGNSEEYWLDIKFKKNADNHFHFIGTKTLRMSDFYISPPTAFMGMIKVNDKIKISLDLEIIIN